MKTITAGKFKAHCLSLLDEVAKKHDKIIVTKDGKPIAELIPVPTPFREKANPLKDSIVFEENIVEFVDADWEAEQ